MSDKHRLCGDNVCSLFRQMLFFPLQLPCLSQHQHSQWRLPSHQDCNSAVFPKQESAKNPKNQFWFPASVRSNGQIKPFASKEEGGKCTRQSISKVYVSIFSTNLLKDGVLFVFLSSELMARYIRWVIPDLPTSSLYHNNTEIHMFSEIPVLHTCETFPLDSHVVSLTEKLKRGKAHPGFAKAPLTFTWRPKTQQSC